MKYNQPAGEAADAPYLDGNRSAGVKGSIVPAAAIEFGQRELVNLIAFAGLTPSNADLEQVRKAIQAMIAAATGGGAVEDYILLSQARTRLPIFPEVLSADGRINVASPAAGSVLVPATVACQHRGIYPFNTSDYAEPGRTFATVANKTYHLRWTPGAGFALVDVADAVYNPGGLKAENDAAFDTTLDDMLVARVVTDAGNVATVTNLANRPELTIRQMLQGTNIRNPDANPTWYDIGQTLNWARRPSTASLAVAKIVNNVDRPDSDMIIIPRYVGTPPQLSTADVPALDLDRYRLSQTVACDFTLDFWMHFSARA